MIAGKQIGSIPIYAFAPAEEDQIKAEIRAADVLAFDCLAKVIAEHAPAEALNLHIPLMPRGFLAEWVRNHKRMADERRRWAPQ